MASEYADRKRLTFEQAEGAEPLPSQLKLKEVSPELRARLWAIFHQNLINAGGDGELSGPFAQVLYDLHVQRFCRAADEFSPFGYAWVSQFKPVFMDGNYIQIFFLALYNGCYATRRCSHTAYCLRGRRSSPS